MSFYLLIFNMSNFPLVGNCKGFRSITICKVSQRKEFICTDKFRCFLLSPLHTDVGFMKIQTGPLISKIQTPRQPTSEQVTGLRC